MLQQINKVIVSAIRSSGQALDAVGRTLETNSYIEKCKHYYSFILYIFYNSNFIN